MIDLADARDEVAVLAKKLGERDRVRRGGAEIGLEVIDAERVGPHAGHERGAARIAERILTISSPECDAALGEAIEVWRFGDGIAEASEARVEVVDRDEEDVA